MKKKLFFGVSIAALMLASCGGAEETTEETGEVVDSVEVVEAVTYEIDTTASVINWINYAGEEKNHWGTVKVLSGTYTVEGDLITAASLSANMNTITSDDEMGGEKLAGHLVSPDFFDVNKYASAEFTFNKHEEGMVHGTLNAAGLEFAVEAPVTLTEGVVTVGEFKVDMSALGFFTMEKEKEKDQAKWHDANIGFSANIVAKQ
jgi:polyisoprenoid-binding protein YceI